VDTEGTAVDIHTVDMEEEGIIHQVFTIQAIHSFPSHYHILPVNDHDHDIPPPHPLPHPIPPGPGMPPHPPGPPHDPEHSFVAREYAYAAMLGGKWRR